MAIFPGSLDARICALMAAVRLQDPERAGKLLAWLLTRHPDHPLAPEWRNAREWADAEIEKARKAKKRK